nr:MAG TPA: hypothetical protein [Caudoviricetes sp.]
MEQYRFIRTYPDQDTVLIRGVKRIYISHRGITQAVDFLGWYSEDNSIEEHCQADFDDLNRKRNEFKKYVEKVYDKLEEKVV